MHLELFLRAAGALTLCLPLAAAPVAAPDGPAPDEACAPPGQRAPQLSVQRNLATGTTRIHLQADPALAGGHAALFCEDPHGPYMPRGWCTSGLRGRVLVVDDLDQDGTYTWNLKGGRPGLAAQLRALTWPQGGTWAETGVSNVLRMPPGWDSGAQLPAVGGIVISEIQKDPTAVSDSQGEWIELHNTSAAAIDIEGWTLADLGSDQTQLDNAGAGIVVPPGGYLVLGREADSALNGGVPVDATYGGFTLSNGEDEVVLIDPAGVVIDEIAYDDGVLWPDDAGRSISLRPECKDAACNDDGGQWCSSQTPIGAGPDTGTPGAPNDPCGG